jgi:hypothetical protein
MASADMPINAKSEATAFLTLLVVVGLIDWQIRHRQAAGSADSDRCGH